MSGEQTETAASIWNKIPPDAKRLCPWMKEVSIDLGGLETIVGEPTEKTKKALRELLKLGIVKQVTQIEEDKEVVECLKPKRDLLAPKAGDWTEEERKWSRAQGRIEEYERNIAESHPDRNKRDKENND